MKCANSISESVSMGKVIKKPIRRWFKSSMILSKEKKRQRTAKVKHHRERITHFDDLPNEVLLIICRYLNPADVLKAFIDYNDRMFCCISEYRTNIDLTKCSYADLHYFLKLLTNGNLQPSTLVVSNAQIPTQIEIFSNARISSVKCYTNEIRHLSFLECTKNDLSYQIKLNLNMSSSLQSLRVVESVLSVDEWRKNSSIIKSLRELLFNNKLTTLTELELSTNKGIILDKQMCTNRHLKRLIISLNKIDDLFILLDGLLPNLIVLNVTLCQSHFSKRLLLPQCWPRQFMSHLTELRLQTNENVQITFNDVRAIVMPLIELDKLTLDVKWLIGNNQQWLQENLISQFMPRLRSFYCSIQTVNYVNMQTFAMLSDRWPIACGSSYDNSRKHVYTVPWSFEELRTSMLADDDTASVCPNVRRLTVDKPYTNLSWRFPNIDTLTILPGCDLSLADCVGFRRLCHLKTTNIEMVPSPARHIHTLTLIETNNILTHSIIHSNVHHVILEKTQLNSWTTVIVLVRYFPNLHSLKIKFKSKAEYFDGLDVLLDGQHLPHLSLLKTNWFSDNDTSCSDIEVWITANTPLKWRSTPFYGHCNDNQLTICL